MRLRFHEGGEERKEVEGWRAIIPHASGVGGGRKGGNVGRQWHNVGVRYFRIVVKATRGLVPRESSA